MGSRASLFAVSRGTRLAPGISTFKLKQPAAGARHGTGMR
jgi:hypothetical protein